MFSGTEYPLRIITEMLPVLLLPAVHMTAVGIVRVQSRRSPGKSVDNLARRLLALPGAALGDVLLTRCLAAK
jgi:hypothetical protein